MSKRTVIAYSSKERKDDTIDELTALGWGKVRLDTLTADYQVYGLAGGARVEKKEDPSELLKSMAGKPRYNTKKECWRAHADGTPLYYVTRQKTMPDGTVINSIEDFLKVRRADLRSENQREDIQQAVEMMQLMKKEFGVHFVFTDPEDFISTVDSILLTQPGTIYEKKKT